MGRVGFVWSVLCIEMAVFFFGFLAFGEVFLECGFWSVVSGFFFLEMRLKGLGYLLWHVPVRWLTGKADCKIRSACIP
jgi:hypothetical protein